MVEGAHAHRRRASVLRFGDFVVNTQAMELLQEEDGNPLPISPLAFDLLVHLIVNRDRVVPKTELLQRFWSGATVSEGVLSQSIWTIRRALGDTGERKRIIKNVRGRGYRFVAPLKNLPAHPLLSKSRSNRSAAIDWTRSVPSARVPMRSLGRQSHRRSLAGWHPIEFPRPL